MNYSNRELQQTIRSFKNERKNPNKSSIPKSELFPEWLLDRKDFQDTIKSYDTIKDLDICGVAVKNNDMRTAVEKNALEKYCKKFWFFNGMGKSTRLHICDRLRAEHYESFQDIIKPGRLAEKLFFIVKGSVNILTDESRLMLGRFNTFGEKELISSKEYKYTVMTNDSDVWVLVMYKHDYDILAFKPRLKELYLEKDRIRQIPLFSS